MGLDAGTINFQIGTSSNIYKSFAEVGAFVVKYTSLWFRADRESAPY